MKANEKVLSQLKKILTLAARATSQGEIEAAMGRAKALALRHSIELGSVDLTEDTKSAAGIEINKDATLRTRSYYMQPYHRWVFQVLERVFDIKLVYNYSSLSGGKHINHITIIGEATDVAVAVAIYPYLEKVFPAALSKLVTAGVLTYRAEHTNGFYAGLAVGIMKTNEREKRELTKEDANKYAMVLVKKEDLIKREMAVAFPKLKSAKERRREMNATAAAYGQREGEKFNLLQVGAPKESNKLK